MRRPPLVIALAVALLSAGCAGTAPDRDGGAATLVLDGAPQALHAGIVLADARAYDEAEGVRLEVEAPASGDAASLLRTREADLAVMTVDELARARAAGADLVGVMALVQRSPGDPATDRAPVLVTTRRALDERPAMVRGTVEALRRGYDETVMDPESAISALLEQAEGLDRGRARRRLDALLPRFTADAPRIGWLQPARVAAWAKRTGLDPAVAFEPRYANQDPPR